MVLKDETAEGVSGLENLAAAIGVVLARNLARFRVNSVADLSTFSKHPVPGWVWRHGY
jgi:hypothetical protein